MKCSNGLKSKRLREDELPHDFELNLNKMEDKYTNGDSSIETFMGLLELYSKAMEYYSFIGNTELYMDYQSKNNMVLKNSRMLKAIEDMSDNSSTREYDEKKDEAEYLKPAVCGLIPFKKEHVS